MQEIINEKEKETVEKNETFVPEEEETSFDFRTILSYFILN